MNEVATPYSGGNEAKWEYPKEPKFESYENTAWGGNSVTPIDYDPKEFFGQKTPVNNVDLVNQPPHYIQGSVECIDAIQSAVIGKPPYEAWLTGQIMKYVWRYNFKNGLQDLEKAEFYLKRLIAEVREHEPSPVSSL